MGKYVVKKTKTGIKFDLKAGNGEIIANSEDAAVGGRRIEKW